MLVMVYSIGSTTGILELFGTIAQVCRTSLVVFGKVRKRAQVLLAAPRASPSRARNSRSERSKRQASATQSHSAGNKPRIQQLEQESRRSAARRFGFGSFSYEPHLDRRRCLHGLPRRLCPAGRRRPALRQHSRHIRGGRGQVRIALYQAAVAAIRYCATMKAFYAGFKARGKACKVALIAVARKLLVLANALLRDGTRYQPRANSVCPQTP
jgi:hypothetical protein